MRWYYSLDTYVSFRRHLFFSENVLCVKCYVSYQYDCSWRQGGITFACYFFKITFTPIASRSRFDGHFFSSAWHWVSLFYRSR